MDSPRQQLTAQDALIETLGWTPHNGFYLEARHLARLTASIDALGFRTTGLSTIQQKWHSTVRGLTAPHYVRSLYYPDGHLTVECKLLPPAVQPWRVVISPVRLCSNDPLLRHKTTLRDKYTFERQRIQGIADESLFLNEHGELCEGTITNIFLAYENTLHTPPLSCGLLPGILRTYLLDTGQATETVLRLHDLVKGHLYVGNSVRKLVLTKLTI